MSEVPPNSNAELDPIDFDNLVNDILENPELLLDSKLTDDQILEIQKRINPYAGLAGPQSEKSERKRIAAVCYTNLREDYLRRFTATSMVGFIFQVFQEWEVPAVQRRWTPAKSSTVGVNNQPFNAVKLVERLEEILVIAKEAVSAENAYAEAKTLACDSEVVLSETPLKDELEDVAAKCAISENCAAKAAALLYAVTQTVNTLGIEAGNRLHTTATACMKYPEVKDILSRHPMPAPPGQYEIPATNAKEIIGSFLRNWFEFDPNVHVRSGHDAKTISLAVKNIVVNGTTISTDTKDPDHLTYETVRAIAPPPSPEHKKTLDTIMASKKSYNTAVALLRNDDLFNAMHVAYDSVESFRHYLFPVSKDSSANFAASHIPPQDTFHRWSYYTEVNYEELRTITEALYPERIDLDWAIALWDVFEGTEKQVNDAFEKHCQRYQDEVPSSIKALEFGSWSLLADFKENRNKIQFYNKNTEVLKRIIERHTEDKQIGAELMRNRVRQTKAKNINVDGPDAAGLAQYKRNNSENGKDLSKHGVKKVISMEEMRRLEKAQGSIKAAKELELLDQYEEIIQRLGEMEKLRTLDAEEALSLKYARDNIEKVREMVAVPDDTIQVDVFTSNGATGEFGKSHFYTKAVNPTLENAPSEQTVATTVPVVANTELSSLAPFAIKHILCESIPEELTNE